MALAHIKVHGARAGAIAWAPYEGAISEWMREGGNEIAVTLVCLPRFGVPDGARIEYVARATGEGG